MSAFDISAHQHQVEIHGKNLSYLDVGSGPVLLLGHSYLWDKMMWAPQIEVLSQHYRCIAPDLWAHGDSDNPPATCRNLLDIASDMLTLMDRLDIQQFHVIGLSVGAMWGAELVLKAPSRVNSLVMLDSFIGYEPEVTRAKYLGMLATIKQARHIPTSLVDMIAPLFFAKETASVNPSLFEGFKHHLTHIPTERIDSIVELGHLILGRRDTLEYVERFTLPCLIMVGLEDTVRTVLESYLMHDAITASQLVHIPGAGHIATLEQPDFINQQLIRFLDNHAN